LHAQRIGIRQSILIVVVVVVAAAAAAVVVVVWVRMMSG
jgi:hypothetical protein